MPAKKILYCHCAYAQVVPPQVKADVLRGLTASGRSFEGVADLCEMSARRDPALRRLAQASDDAPLAIAACYPRAVKWLFDAAGAPLPDAGVKVCNMRTDDAATILPDLLGGAGDEVRGVADEVRGVADEDGAATDAAARNRESD